MEISEEQLKMIVESSIELGIEFESYGYLEDQGDGRIEDYVQVQKLGYQLALNEVK